MPALIDISIKAADELQEETGKPFPKDISFDGVPTNSNARKYESEWSKRQGTRSTKQCT